MKTINIKQLAYASVATLLLTTCTSDELMDGTVQNLPEGMYPLQIASVSVTVESSAEPWGANAPQSRVSENTNGNSSQWDGGEEITVQLSGTMANGTSYTADGKYILNSDKTSLTFVNGKELYWHSTSAGTVTAWYCNPITASDNTVNLSGQSNGLAYVLKAENKNVTYNTSPSLSFSHQLAKVRVKLTGPKASEITAVKVKGYPSCTIDKTSGTVTKTGTETYLPMIKKTYADGDYYEANLAPQDISTTDFVQLTDKNNVTKTCNVSNVTTLDKAKHYIFNIEVKPAVPTTITRRFKEYRIGEPL